MSNTFKKLAHLAAEDFEKDANKWQKLLQGAKKVAPYGAAAGVGAAPGGYAMYQNEGQEDDIKNVGKASLMGDVQQRQQMARAKKRDAAIANALNQLVRKGGEGQGQQPQSQGQGQGQES